MQDQIVHPVENYVSITVSIFAITFVIFRLMPPLCENCSVYATAISF
uniref:Uncharacterized protein n=1 Tax=Setaria italica TaxID=4555 RepID=K3ZG50_SETIT